MNDLGFSIEDIRGALSFFEHKIDFTKAGQPGTGTILQPNFRRLQDFVNQIEEKRIPLSIEAERLLKFLFDSKSPASGYEKIMAELGFDEEKYLEAFQILKDNKFVDAFYADDKPYTINITKFGRNAVRRNFRLSLQPIEEGHEGNPVASTLKKFPQQKKGTQNIRDQVFISYSRKDKEWLERVQTHLKPLEREGIAKLWDDTLINSGEEWREEIQKALESTKVAVLIITANFIESDFIATEELPHLLEAAGKEGTKILSLIVSASRFEKTESLSKFQTVNPPSLPLNQMEYGKQEKVLVKLANDIESIFNRNKNSSK